VNAQADYVEQGDDQWGNGKILLLPTVIVNQHQYRGRLDVPSILRALCAGFSETTEPQVFPRRYMGFLSKPSLHRRQPSLGAADLTGGFSMSDCAMQDRVLHQKG
jgi:hypothetical protein